jgi:methylenetetrahydrofolate--tRNA-(uracil-5-)-methyltransferase
LNFDLSSKEFPKIHFAGQITGVEGYTESSSMGLYVASQVLRKIKGEESIQWPVETGIGALVNFVMTVPKPVPSSINFGLLPTIQLTKEQRRNKDRKKIKKQLVAEIAAKSFEDFYQRHF